MKITKRKLIESYVRARPYGAEMTTRSIGEGTGLTMEDVQPHVRDMCGDGILVKIREEPGVVTGRRRRKVYMLTGSKIPRDVGAVSDRDLLDALVLLMAEAAISSAWPDKRVPPAAP